MNNNILGFTYNEFKINIDIKRDKKKALSMMNKLSSEYIFNTAFLEWNPLTFVEVKTILDWISVSWHKISDTQMILNLKRSIEYLTKKISNNKFKLNKKIFCKIQSFVAFEEAYKWWKFRDWNVSIAGSDIKVVDFKKLDETFEKWINFLEKEDNIILKAFLLFLFWTISQFFYDWNKRGSRLFANWILLENWYPPLVFYSEDIQEYNNYLMEFYKTKDATEILKWMLKKYIKSSERFWF